MKILIILFLLTTSLSFSQPTPHRNAHAHNDYVHTLPLFDALDNGFCSIEADIHLVGEKLLVAHDRPDASAKTLEELYLRPLDSIGQQNSGHIYPTLDAPVYLLVDIKTDGASTFNALLSLLSKYQSCLNTPSHEGAVQVLISGNRPIPLIRQDPNHLAAIDGRPEDLGKGYLNSEMPWISESYGKVITWNGVGTPPEAEINKLRLLSAKVHEEHKMLRLWGIPDNEYAWQILLAAGVDIINTDKLTELNIFLSNRKK